MASLHGLLLSFIALIHIAISDINYVTDLTDANLDYTVDGVWMVKFYTPLSFTLFNVIYANINL